jgi:hypothetical protein
MGSITLHTADEPATVNTGSTAGTGFNGLVSCSDGTQVQFVISDFDISARFADNVIYLSSVANTDWVVHNSDDNGLQVAIANGAIDQDDFGWAADPEAGSPGASTLTLNWNDLPPAAPQDSAGLAGGMQQLTGGTQRSQA